MNVQSIHDIYARYGLHAPGDSASTVVVYAPHDAPNTTSSIDPNFAHSDLTTFDQLPGLDSFGDTGGPVFLKAHTPTGGTIDTHA